MQPLGKVVCNSLPVEEELTDWQENVTMTSGLGNIVTLTSEVSSLTAAYVLGRLGKHWKHMSRPEMSWKPRGYGSREESGRTLCETIASVVVMQKGPERSCHVLQQTDGSLTGGRQ